MGREKTNKLLKKVGILISLLVIPYITHSQDVHFSQFWNNGVQYNPAMAGVIPTPFRASLFYRNQWSSVQTTFQTYGANIDTRVETKGNAAFGIGAFFYRDVAGDNKLGTTGAQLALSSILSLNRESKLSIGINGGILQRGFDASNAQWSSQYHSGSYDPNASSGEAFNSTAELKGDISAGIVYYYGTGERYMTANDRFSMKIGMAYNHILRPLFQWFSMSPEELYGNFVGHAEFLIGVENSDWSIKPAIIAQFQGPSREILVGSQFQYSLKDASHVTGYVKGGVLSFGTFLRVGDAFIPSITFGMDRYSLGVSYDVNISQLYRASRGAGGFEISFKFKALNHYTWRGHSTY